MIGFGRPLALALIWLLIAVPAGAAESVRVRGGLHQDHGRLVFDWPAPVDYTAEFRDRQLILTFARPAEFDVAQLAVQVSTYVGQPEVSMGGKIITFPLRGRFGLKHFPVGGRVVVDLLRDASQIDEASPGQPPEPSPLATLLPTLTAPAPGLLAARPLSEFLFRVETRAEPSAAEPQSGPVAALSQSLVLRFDWGQETGAAVFQRGAEVVLVFDRKLPADFSGRLARAAPRLGKISQIDGPASSSLQFTVAPLIEPRLARDRTAWLVDLGTHSVPPSSSFTADSVTRNGVEILRLKAIGALTIVPLTDPASGGKLLAVPLAIPGQGMAKSVRFQGFTLLPSVQGLVFAPVSDGIEIALGKDRVEVAFGGVSLSGSLGTSGVETAAVPQRRLFDLPAWRQGPLEAFRERRQALQRAVVAAAPDALTAARLELARFYFAHGLASEALGVLDLIHREAPELVHDPESLLLEAASAILNSEFERGGKILDHPVLAEEPEAELWQAMLAAAGRDWAAATGKFAANRELIEDYPRALRVRIRLAAAEAALVSEDTTLAASHLEDAEADLTTSLEKAGHSFVKAALLLETGARPAAVEGFSEVANGSFGAASARARLALVGLGLEDGTLTADAAIAELEQLRFAWRGDAFEFAVLVRLGELYDSQGQEREALRALREAVTYFPNTQMAEDVGATMRAIFARAFDAKSKRQLPALAALSLYDEFMDLTPSGPEGDALIARLADRLVEADLLERAANLLEQQVKYRLSGVEQARVGTRLALIRLLDHLPKEALEALDLSALAESAAESPGGTPAGSPGVSPAVSLPETLERQRRHLRARALADLDRGIEGLALLEGDESRESRELRVEIHWRLNQWAQAADEMASLLPPLPADEGAPLDEGSSRRVLNMAIAVTLGGDPEGRLDSLRDAYGPVMARGPHREAFSLVAGVGEIGEPRSIAAELATVETVEAFMASYRDKVRQGQLSEIN